MNPKTGKLLTAALGAGALSLCLRLLLYRTGFDEKNILSSFHPLHLACLALAGLFAVYLAFSVRKLDGGSNPEVNFPSHPLRSCGMFAAGCLIAVHGVNLTQEADTLLSVVRAGLALAAACSMALCALVPANLRTLHSLCRGLITAFFALDMLCRYQDWSGNPQLPDYVLQVFACVLLCLCSYHRLAFDVGLGRRRRLLWCSLMALYLSLACVSGPETRAFFLGGAIWSGACMCTIEPSAEENKEETP